MAFKQIILSEQFVRAQSVINDSVDFKLLRPIIFMIQDTKLKQLLGSNLYNDILTQTTPPTSLTGANQVLVDDYILPCLHWYLVAEHCIVTKFRFMNKGIMEKNSDNSQQTSTDDLKFIERRYSNMAECYGQDMKNYIIANPTLYPSYWNNAGIDKTQPIRTVFKTPFYLPGLRNHSTFTPEEEENFRRNNPSWPR